MADRGTEHSARVDDEMAAEVESLTRGAPVEARADEWRLSEPAGDGEPVPESVVEFANEPLSGALDENERRRRSELAASLPGHAFPAERDALRRVAEREHAAPWVIDALATLPIDTRFDTPQDVWTALGGHRDARAGNPPASAPTAPVTSPAAPSRVTLPTARPAALDGVLQGVAVVASIGTALATTVVGGMLGIARRVFGGLRRDR